MDVNETLSKMSISCSFRKVVVLTKKVLLSWSSGKDCAWALHILKQQQEYEVVGLFSTLNEEYNRVAMHGVREVLVKKQAEAASLPLEIIYIPNPCSHEDYERVMGEFVARAKIQGIEYFAFGDLFLEDIRKYREEKLKDTGIKALFPVWGVPTRELSQQMIDAGLKAKITCIDLKHLPNRFAGMEFGQAMLNELPTGVDPCGEYGEFHSFAYEGPMFSRSIAISVAEVVERDGFVFADVLPDDNIERLIG